MKPKRRFTVVIERDEEGFYVATVPELKGCHTQARNLDTLMRRTREVIELCLPAQVSAAGRSELIGVQQVSI